MVRKILFALFGVTFFLLAGLARASLLHEIYFLNEDVLTAGSLAVDGSTVENDLQPSIAAIGTLTLDETAENGGFSCGGNCADFATLEIEVFQQPDLTVTVNNFQPPESITFTAEIVMIDFAQVNSDDWSLILNNLVFTTLTTPWQGHSLLNLNPISTPGINTNGDMMIVPSRGTCTDYTNSLDSFCASLNFDRPVDVVSYPVHDVPEPNIIALLSIGLAGLGFTRRRMKA
jgi:hypothetical protein